MPLQRLPARSRQRDGSSPEQPALNPRVTRILSGTALVTAFGMLAVFNSGGYRYGASDQAFYVPAIMRHVDPSAVPARPRAHRRCRTTCCSSTACSRTIVTATGATVANVLFGAYLIMLLAVAGAGWLFGRALLATRWGAAALVLAMSIRHRVPKTGVNTLEHYFQPRMVAFAVGSAGLAALVRQRTWLALALAFGAGLVHPTTGFWFSVVIAGGAVIVVPRTATDPADPRVGGSRRGRIGLLLRAHSPAAWSRWMPSGFRASRRRTTCFRTSGLLETWLQHALYLVVVAVSFYARRRLALAGRGEHALVAGLLAMLLVLGVSLPAVSARIALAVQLQVSRAMWLFDLSPSRTWSGGWWRRRGHAGDRMIALCRQVIFGLGRIPRRRRAVPLGAGPWQWSPSARWPVART